MSPTKPSAGSAWRADPLTMPSHRSAARWPGAGTDPAAPNLESGVIVSGWSDAGRASRRTLPVIGLAMVSPAPSIYPVGAVGAVGDRFGSPSRAGF